MDNKEYRELVGENPPPCVFCGKDSYRGLVPIAFEKKLSIPESVIATVHWRLPESESDPEAVPVCRWHFFSAVNKRRVTGNSKIKFKHDEETVADD